MASISGIEIIDFYRPSCNRKNLFMTNIVSSMETVDVEDQLHCKFSQYGLLYEVQVFKSKNQSKKDNSVIEYAPNATAFYAFIKFYSALSASRAQKNLTGKCFIGEKCCKIVFAKRQKGTDTKVCLSVSQCVELANYYLGFNGWSDEIKLMKNYTRVKLEEDELLIVNKQKMENGTSVDNEGEIETVKFICVTKLFITGHFLSSQGFGVWEDKYSKNGEGKAIAFGKARKISKQRALQNAMSKLLLIVLPNGKVTVEVNTLIPDQFPIHDDINEKDVLEVNELQVDLDKINSSDENIDNVLHNLQDLEESIEEVPS